MLQPGQTVYSTRVNLPSQQPWEINAFVYVLVVSDSLPPHGLGPTRLLCPWDFPGMGKIEGRRRRGIQKMRWLDGITDSMDVSLSELRVFLELSCFFDDPGDVGNLISGSSAFSKSSLNICKFTVHVLLKPGLENLEHYFAGLCRAGTR